MMILSAMDLSVSTPFRSTVSNQVRIKQQEDTAVHWKLNCYFSYVKRELCLIFLYKNQVNQLISNMVLREDFSNDEMKASKQ